MDPGSRSITHRYVDPLDAIWLSTAERLGLRIERRPDVYASTDDRGTLFLASHDLDPDDCLAQMILHEICHWLVMGADARRFHDWGLCNETDRDVALEHACLRTQASLLAPHGLRDVLGPTTDFRAFYDALGPDPLRYEGSATSVPDESLVRARVAVRRATKRPWAPHLAQALEATATVIRAVRDFTPRTPSTGQSRDEPLLPSLHERLQPAIVPHPSGLCGRSGDSKAHTCGSCTWSYSAVPDAAETASRGTASEGSRDEVGKALRCRQANADVKSDWSSCALFEDDVDCLTCGACCREAYDVVAVEPDDPAIPKHRQLMVVHEGRAEMRRDGGRCTCLRGGAELRPLSVDPSFTEPPRYQPNDVPFTCDIYETRPRPCRDFELGGEHCLTARRRVGLSL